MFQHQKEQIKIGLLAFPLSFFQEQEPNCALPEGAIGRDYTPSVEHVILYPGRSVGAELPWGEGDTYLSKVEQYREAWESANEPAPPTLEQVKAQKIALFDKGCQLEIWGGFDSDALGEMHHYSSEPEDQLNLIGKTFPGIDTLFICTGLDGVKTAKFHTAAQMRQVYQTGEALKTDKIVKFHTLCAQVEATETIEAVNLINW